MREVLLTREDANTEFALLAEWLVADGASVASGEPVCVIETTKATVEVEAPGHGALVHLYAVGAEVELGSAVGLIAESDAELSEARERATPATPVSTDGPRATRKARELASRHEIDLAAIEKRGFITTEDVEALIENGDSATLRSASDPGDPDAALLDGLSTANVSLPGSWSDEQSRGALDAEFLSRLRRDPTDFIGLSSDEKCAAYREHGAVIGDGVLLAEDALILAARVVIGDGVELGARARIDCAEAFCVGELTHIGPDLEVRCRRAFLGANIHGGRSVRIGGGGHRDPWAIVAIGDLAFLGDEVFINACRPVLIGRETFVTQRSMIVTHNVGHSLLEGFENRFAPVVVEDLAQVGLGAVVYAGCRIGERAIVASNSYVVSDIPAGKLAIGVPARAAGDAQIRVSEERRAELADRMFRELFELLELRGHQPSWVEGASCFRVAAGQVALVETLTDAKQLPPPEGESVALTLSLGAASPPDGWAVLDLRAREIYGDGGALLDSVREFCRKRGIRFAGAPWRYAGGLV
ncbi:MAG: biotin/lipoyl-containing protein [Gaiellaceae bacterium]